MKYMATVHHLIWISWLIWLFAYVAVTSHRVKRTVPHLALFSVIKEVLVFTLDQVREANIILKMNLFAGELGTILTIYTNVILVINSLPLLRVVNLSGNVSHHWGGWDWRSISLDKLFEDVLSNLRRWMDQKYERHTFYDVEGREEVHDKSRKVISNVEQCQNDPICNPPLSKIWVFLWVWNMLIYQEWESNSENVRGRWFTHPGNR